MSFLEAKAQELRKDIEILNQTFERIVDRKDAILKSLVKDSDEAEEQYQVALRSHIQNIDELIGEYSIFLLSLSNYFFASLFHMLLAKYPKSTTCTAQLDEG